LSVDTAPISGLRGTAATPSYEAEQELRLALVLYGGVSLAIYMYGVADEIYRLVRATAPVPTNGMPDEPRALAFPEATGTEAVYRRIGQLLPIPEGDPQPDPPPTDAPVRTRFLVDLIAGTSAGGINGICLAKALANETRLDSLKKLWLEQGDLAKLMNDEQSKPRYKLSTFPYQPPPASLLDGRQMTTLLLTALEEMNSASANPSDTRLVDELDLWVTTTDLEGLDVPITLSRGAASERRYKHRSHFRFARDENLNDFHGADSDFLAYAARCTAAFPSAFEPMQLEMLDRLGVELKDWSRYYSSYPNNSDPLFPKRSFSDGGILDNKPFSYVTEALRRRRATLPVARKLIYVEPDPTSPADVKPPRQHWNVLDTVQAALLGIPRAEGIRDDIQAVLARNRSIARVQELVAAAGTTDPERSLLLELARRERTPSWGDQTLAQTAAAHDWGPAYTTYHRLKARGVVDFLAGLIVGAAGLDPESDDAFAVHYLVRAWRNDPDVAPTGGSNQFLFEYDLPYRIRRLTFVIDKLKAIRRGNLQPLALPLSVLGLEPGEDSAGAPDQLTRLMGDLDNLRSGLADTGRDLIAGGALSAAIGGAGITRAALKTCLDAGGDSGMLEVATGLVAANRGSFADIAGILSGAIAEAAVAATEEFDRLVPPVVWERGVAVVDPVAAALRFYYDTYEAYDAILYPIQFATGLGETNPVEILRISPLDADAPKEIEGSARELYGMRLGHFGAFFDQSWRGHDIVWGRLNGSECLIRGLLPNDHPEVDELVERAHDSIIDDYARELEVPAGQDNRAWFATYRPAMLDRRVTEASIGRIARIIARLGDSLIGQRSSDTPATESSTPQKAWKAATQLLAPDHRRSLGTLGGMLRPFLPLPWLKLTAIVLAPVAAGTLLVVWKDGGWAVLGWTFVGIGVGLAAVAILLLWGAAWAIAKVRGIALGRLTKLLDELDPRPESPGSQPSPGISGTSDADDQD
jgi:patatin-related protein